MSNRISTALAGLTTTDYPKLHAAYVAAVEAECDELLAPATRAHAAELRAKLARRVLHYHNGGTL